MNETGAYRIMRYWLAGPRRGTAQVFADDLPGLPDNVTWSAERGVFWVALYSPRVASLDALASHPFLRKVTPSGTSSGSPRMKRSTRRR